MQIMIIITVIWKTDKNEKLPAASEQSQGQHSGAAGSQTQVAVSPLLCLNKFHKHTRAPPFDQPFILKQAGHLSPCTSGYHPSPWMLSPFHSLTSVLLLPLPPHLHFCGFPLPHPTTRGTEPELVCPAGFFWVPQGAEPKVKH